MEGVAASDALKVQDGYVPVSKIVAKFYFEALDQSWQTSGRSAKVVQQAAAHQPFAFQRQYD